MARKRKGNPVSGWFILDKPDGMTSTQAVGAVRRLYDAQKAGHAGTLDPLASGVLPIALGEATKTVPYVQDAEKVYRFTIRWGASTTTIDREGEVTATSDVRPSPEAIEAALQGFVGEKDQVPPAFSAIKVDGERAYDLARAGETVELQPRRVLLHEARLASAPSADLAVIEARTGKGYYVRALVRDLAEALGAEGHVAALRRTRVGPFGEAAALSLDEAERLVHEEHALAGLAPVETALDGIPALAVTDREAAEIKQGRAIVLLPRQTEELQDCWAERGSDEDRTVQVLCTGRLVALGEARAGRFQPKRLFHLDAAE